MDLNTHVIGAMLIRNCKPHFHDAVSFERHPFGEGHEVIGHVTTLSRLMAAFPLLPLGTGHLHGVIQLLMLNP